MKKNIQVPDSLRTRWQGFTGYQQGSTIYFALLVCALIFLPLIKINYLDSTQVDTFTLVHKYMGKTAVLIGLILAFLIGYNFSTKFRHWLNTIFGVTSNVYLTNVSGLLMILIALFSVGDTVTLLKQSFSSRVGTTSGFLVVGVLVILGIIGHMMLARISHKKRQTTKEVTIQQETDTSGYEPGFEKAQKEVEGLFGGESM